MRILRTSSQATLLQASKRAFVKPPSQHSPATKSTTSPVVLLESPLAHQQQTRARLRNLSTEINKAKAFASPINHRAQEESRSSVLAGKRCIITGASRGIGAGIAERFAREGASCVLVGRNEALLESVRGALRVVEGGEEHRVVVGDVGDGRFWEGMRREKQIDVLVNAAGITHASPLFTTSPVLLEEVVQTNLLGTMMACRTVGRNMMADRGGCIINVASLLGLKGGRGSVAYAASKAGVMGLTRALAAEVGAKGIRVNVIVPGYIETDMTSGMTTQARAEALDAIPLGRFGLSSEIADAAVFLATNQYANNCVVSLDGGLSAV